jgi:hypothetical protein
MKLILTKLSLNLKYKTKHKIYFIRDSDRMQSSHLLKCKLLPLKLLSLGNYCIPLYSEKSTRI